MRMFKVIKDGIVSHRPAGRSTAEELQHHLVHEEGHKSVRVIEYIKGGARAPIVAEEDVEDE